MWHKNFEDERLKNHCQVSVFYPQMPTDSMTQEPRNKLGQMDGLSNWDGNLSNIPFILILLTILYTSNLRVASLFSRTFMTLPWDCRFGSALDMVCQKKVRGCCWCATLQGGKSFCTPSFRKTLSYCWLKLTMLVNQLPLIVKHAKNKSLPMALLREAVLWCCCCCCCCCC